MFSMISCSLSWVFCFYYGFFFPSSSNEIQHHNIRSLLHTFWIVGKKEREREVEIFRRYIFYVDWKWPYVCVTSLNIYMMWVSRKPIYLHKIIQLFFLYTFFSPVWQYVNKFPENRRKILRFVHFREKIPHSIQLYTYICMGLQRFFFSFILSLDISYLPDVFI